MSEAPKSPEDRRDDALIAGCRAVRDEIEKQGFVDYYFIGKNLFQERVSTFSIGLNDEKRAAANAVQIDNMVGALVRQIISWHVKGMADNGELKEEE